MRLTRLWPVLAGMLVVVLGSKVQAQSVDGAVTLYWTAPGDDSLSGTASRYDIRYSLFPITDASFSYCSGVGGLPRPASAGVPQQFTVYGLLPGIRYYFAMKTADERLNWSHMSNVVAFAGVATGVDAGIHAAQLAFQSPFPNPARVSTTFAYGLPAAAHTRVEIFDVQGRVVQVLVNGELPAGAGTFVWNLRDMQGGRVAPGVYLARARLGDTVFVRRVLVQS